MPVARNASRLRKTTLPLLLLVLAVLLPAAPCLAASERAFVTVKKTSIRKDRQFSAPTVAEARFRDELLVLARDKAWLRVGFNGVEGWVHLSATAARAVSVSAMEATGGVSQDDVAFASKGFDATVEKEYRKGKSQANFAGVDRMEQLTVPERELADFRTSGNLRPRGGPR